MILEHQKFRAEIWKCKHSWNWLAGFSKLRSSRIKPLRRLTDFSHPQKYRNYQFRHIVDLFSLTLVTALLLSRKLKGLRRFKETLSIRKNPHKSPRNWGFPLEKKFVPPPISVSFKFQQTSDNFNQWGAFICKSFFTRPTHRQNIAGILTTQKPVPSPPNISSVHL